MSISYNAITNYGKVTLPSVETWSTNMNILRDPPKSITTRKIDKVGETSEITQMIQESGDRVCEGISVYAKGVNPMVGISYNNYGNNSGTRGNNHAPKNAFLPHRIMKDGAFRPEVKDQRQLLPLSRQPRNVTSLQSQPGFIDFTKKISCPSDKIQGVKKNEDTLKYSIRPTAVYKIELPIENQDIKRVTKNPIIIDMKTQKQSKFRKNGNMEISNKINSNTLKIDSNINKIGFKKNIQTNIVTENYTQDVLHSNAISNLKNTFTKNNTDMNINSENYTQDVLHSSANTNISQNINVTPIDNLYFDNHNLKTLNNIEHNTNHIGYNKIDYIHKDIEIEKNIPIYNANTNIGYNIYKKPIEHVNERIYLNNRPSTNAITNIGNKQIQKIDTINSRDYNLKPTVNPGGMEPLPNLPMINRENHILEFDKQKIDFRKRVYNMSHDRNIDMDRDMHIKQFA